MKKIMILVSAIMMAATVNAKRVETESFNEVCVNVPARVRIIPGESYSVNVAAADSTLAESLRINVANGVLKINPAVGSAEDLETPMVITIVSPVELEIKTGRNFYTTTIHNSYPSSKKDLASK